MSDIHDLLERASQVEPHDGDPVASVHHRHQAHLRRRRTLRSRAPLAVAAGAAATAVVVLAVSTAGPRPAVEPGSGAPTSTATSAAQPRTKHLVGEVDQTEPDLCLTTYSVTGGCFAVGGAAQVAGVHTGDCVAVDVVPAPHPGLESGRLLAIRAATATELDAAAGFGDCTGAPGSPEALKAGQARAASKAGLQQAAEAAAAAAPRAPKTPPAPGSLPTAPPETWASGIVDIHQPPHSGFWQVNEWDGQINGQNAVVHAGVEAPGGVPAPQAPGVVVITTDPCTACNVGMTDYPDPGTVGPFRITSVQFPRVVLRDARGTTSTFDAVTHAFSR